MKTPMRNDNKFHSEFTKWTYANCGNEFYFGDIDGIAYKKATRILRVIEWKHSPEDLSDGQNFYLPILDAAIELLVKSGVLSIGSGVFIVRGNPPGWEDGIEVNRIGKQSVKITTQKLKEFISCNR